MSTTDIASLVLRIDSSQVEVGNTALSRLNGTSAGVEQQTHRTASATSLLSRAFGALAAVAGTVGLAALAKDATLLAARYETMGVVMKIAGNNAGYTKVQMDAFAKSLQQSGISMLQSRNVLTQLASANIELASASALARAAQDLAVVANINSSEALERMTQGIIGGEVEILQTLGMQVQWEAGYKKLAAQLGTTSDKLTEHQKIVARTNAVIEEGAKYNGIYEESMGTAGKALTSLTRYWEDLKVKIGEAALPAFSDAIFTLTDALKAANKELDAAGSNGTIDSIGKGLASAFATVKETVLVLGANVAYVFAGIGREIAAIAAQAVAVYKNLDFVAAGGIGEALRKDNETAKKALLAFENSVMKVGKGNATQLEESMLNARSSSKKTEEQRIAEGAAARKAKEAEDALAAKKKGGGGGGAKGGSSEADTYKQLTKAIYEKTAAAALEDDGTRKLTDGENVRAKLLYDLTNGQVKLTAAHKSSILVKLDALIIAEQEKAMAIAYSKTMQEMNTTVVTADDSTRELDAAQKVLLETMRQPEWERMPLVWKETVIAQAQSASELIKISNRQAELNELQRQTPSAVLEKTRETMIDLADEYERGTFGLVGSTEAMSKYAEIVDVALGRSSESIQKQADAMDKFAEAAATNIQKTMADFLFDPFANGTKGMVEAFGTAVRKMIADAVAADLGKRLFGNNGTGISSLFSKGFSLVSGLLGASTGVPTLAGAGTATENWIDSGGLGSSAESGGGLFGLLSGILPKFDAGTPFVERDTAAIIHRGERVLTSEENAQGIGDTYILKQVLPKGSTSETKLAAGQGAQVGFAMLKRAKRFQ